MTEDDYVAFCNMAFDLRSRAERFFAQMGDEHLKQLGGLVRSEMAASAGGRVEPAYDFLAGILAEEIQERKRPNKNVIQMPRRFEDGPF